eukprot:9496248-Pyramimonas_sp.AAC.4
MLITHSLYSAGWTRALCYILGELIYISYLTTCVQDDGVKDDVKVFTSDDFNIVETSSEVEDNLEGDVGESEIAEGFDEEEVGNTDVADVRTLRSSCFRRHRCRRYDRTLQPLISVSLHKKAD